MGKLTTKGHLGYSFKMCTEFLTLPAKMIVTKKYIQDLREKSFMDISADMEKLIFEKFGKDPEPDDDGCSYSYTEQDILEQIRKMIQNQK